MISDQKIVAIIVMMAESADVASLRFDVTMSGECLLRDELSSKSKTQGPLPDDEIIAPPLCHVHLWFPPTSIEVYIICSARSIPVNSPFPITSVFHLPSVLDLCEPAGLILWFIPFSLSRDAEPQAQNQSIRCVGSESLGWN